VIVVGAGIAGVACAVQLRAAGIPVTVLERSRVVGGRMASRSLHGRPVDLGAAYFTVSDPEFAELVGRWRTAGLARPWTDEPAVLENGSRSRAPGPVRWSAPAGLRSLVQELSAGLDVVTERTVRHVGPGPEVDGEHADLVVLAMPDPQALRLVHPSSPAAGALAEHRWRPAIAVAAGWPSRQWDPLPVAFVNGHPTLALVADDGDRRADGASVLVALRDLLGVRTPPDWTYAHRWRFSAPEDSRAEPFHLGDDGIALAGDGWGRSRVETAWRSGTLLGRAVVARGSGV
jgi:predicted NAD/FAD-dependent oxidoreductase